MLMNDLKMIKKYYGENMMKLCRLYFPTILEEEGLLYNILNENFYKYRYLAEDIVEQKKEKEFQEFIFSKVIRKQKAKILTNKTPFELFDEAGYILYECKSNEDIEKFRECYSQNELLCTFRENRLDRCYVFFALKKNWQDINRSSKPSREDEYATSVISIQFNKGNVNNVSIKNRYNDIVPNPDATFSNNLDNIIGGLINSFENEYNYNIFNSYESEGIVLNNYVRGFDNIYYKYNIEVDGIYYCVNNVVVKEFDIKKYDKEKYILMECYLLDLENKKIKDLSRYDSSLSKSIGNMQRIEVLKKELSKEVIIQDDKKNPTTKISLSKDNQIIKLDLPNAYKIGHKFLVMNESLREINLENATQIGDWALFYNLSLEKINLPKLKVVGTNFMDSNKLLKVLNAPLLKEVGKDFLCNNDYLEDINIDSVEIIEDNFLSNNELLSSISIPNIERIGLNFLNYNKNIDKLKLLSLAFKNELSMYEKEEEKTKRLIK